MVTPVSFWGRNADESSEEPKRPKEKVIIRTNLTPIKP